MMETATRMSKRELASRIDHSGLKPFLRAVDIQKLCEEAVTFGCITVCINPANVMLAAEVLKGTSVGICSVIGFPFGASKSKIKAVEAQTAVQDGATEIDMVINIGALKSGEYEIVQQDIKKVVQAVEGIPVKVILENGYLLEEEKIKACQLAGEAGAAYIKTATGFGPSGSTLHDLQLMKQLAAKYGMKVKAAGGIRWYEDAIAAITAGADRIGVSATAQILEGAPK